MEYSRHDNCTLAVLSEDFAPSDECQVSTYFKMNYDQTLPNVQPYNRALLWRGNSLDFQSIAIGYSKFSYGYLSLYSRIQHLDSAYEQATVTSHPSPLSVRNSWQYVQLTWRCMSL
jgi:hypothetical protein